MEGIASDKVNINVGGGEGGGGGYGAGLAAVIAALGNRNQGNDNAALIAALGNRNDDSANWVGPLMAMAQRGHHDDSGFGGNGIWAILLLALLRGRGGFGGGDDCGDGNGRTAILQTLMEGQSDLRAAVPATALETQNQICQSLASLALGVQQGFANNKDATQAALLATLQSLSNVKDTVQNGFTITNNNVLEGLCKVKETVRDDGDKTRGQIALYHEANLQRQLGVAESALAEERTARRVRDVEVSVSQNVNQTQAQAQAQWQHQRFEDERFNRLFAIIANIGNQVQRTRSDQDIVNLGTMTASGTQAAQSTQIR